MADVQALLAPDEAMLVYFVSSQGSWLWAVRSDRAEFHKLDIDDNALSGEVVKLRERLDPDLNPDLTPFDAKRSYALYQKIIAPAAGLLDGARLVFVVPDGALESLPLGVLVTKTAGRQPGHPGRLSRYLVPGSRATTAVAGPAFGELVAGLAAVRPGRPRRRGFRGDWRSAAGGPARTAGRSQARRFVPGHDRGGRYGSAIAAAS